MKDIFFICHSSYRRGIPFDPNFSITFGFLNHYFGEKQYSTIRHSLYKGGESRIYKEGNTNCFYVVPFLGSFFDPIRYVFELITNFFILVVNKPKVVIAIDPLSCFVPSFLWKIGYIKRVFFITPDFAERRFKNKILNKIYFSIDKFCTFNSNKNIVCAQAVIDYKEKIYKAPKEIFFHMPNIPNPWIIQKFSNIEKIENRIIYVGNISNQINFLEIFDGFLEAKKKVHNLSMVIVGSGDLEDYLKSKIKINNIKDVIFTGQLNYESTLCEIAKSEIGIALYNGAFNYDKYRDSCKIREYQSLGVIPITTDVVKANAEEIIRFKSGIIFKKNMKLADIFFSILQERGDSFGVNMEKNCKIYSSKYLDLRDLISC